MTVTIEWSTSSTFSSTTELIDHGNSSNGDITEGIEIFIRHDGSNPITSCSFYLQPFTGTYSGDATASDDFTEITEWGASSTSSTFGGCQINMDMDNGYTSTFSSISYTSKDVLDTGEIVAFTARQDDGGGAVGINTTSAVTLHTNMGLSTAGEIPTGTQPGVAFKARIQIPTSEDTAGIRQFSQVLKYTFTS